jgi:hypothetical protein
VGGSGPTYPELSAAPGNGAAVGVSPSGSSATNCSAAFLLSALSRRCTIECCFVPNSSGYFSLSRPTIASARSTAGCQDHAEPM